MKCIDLKIDESVKEDISKLYLSAFPIDERPPLDWFLRCLYECENNHAFAYYDNDEFIGFSEITIFEDIVYICYLAVSPIHRNKGYGTQILDNIKQKYNGYTILLCFEEVDEKYDDYLNRKRREDFYIRNGFINNDLKTKEGPVIYQSSRIGDKKVNFDQYRHIFDQCYGKGTSDIYLKEAK